LQCTNEVIFNELPNFEETMLFLTKDVILVTENEVITLAKETMLSIKIKNKFFVGILLSISTIENILVEFIEFCLK